MKRLWTLISVIVPLLVSPASMARALMDCNCDTLFAEGFAVHQMAAELDSISPMDEETHSLPERLLAENDGEALNRLNEQSRRLRAQWPHLHVLDTVLYLRKKALLSDDVRDLLLADLEKHADLMERDFGPDWREHFGL